MPIETQTKTIDGYTFAITQLPGRRGFKVFNRLLKVIGAAGPALFGGKDDMKITAAAMGVLSAAREEDLDFLATELLTTGTVQTPDGKVGPINTLFDDVFTGNVFLLYKAIFFSIQVNGFSKGLVERVAAMAKERALDSISPKSSEKPGPAGD